MIQPNNPFLVSEYLSPEYFCDRKQETEDIINNLHNGWNITLIAPRRIGKTGLIKNAFHLLKENNQNIHTYYIDIMGTQNLNDFITLLGTTVLGTLDSDWKKAIKHVGEVIKSCRPSLTFDEQNGTPVVSLDIDPAKQETTLKEIFEYMASSEKTCYVAIDEFQCIAEYTESAEAIIRSYMQFVPNVKFIFAGSKQHMLEQMFNNAKRPFYRSTRTMQLDVIPAETYCEFAQRFFEKQGRPLTADIFLKLYRLVNGHTWYVQALLKELYSYYQPIDEELLERAYRSLVKDNASYYETIYENYTPTQRRLLKAIAKERMVLEINGSSFISKYKMKAASSVQTAIKTFVNEDTVCKSKEGYRLYDPFFAEWLRRL